MLLVILVAALAAGLTLFSGFGLGSLLLPAFAVFFPLDVAVAATAVVHLANNLFKAALLGRYADLRVVAAFAIPGAVAAFAGAWVLHLISELPTLSVWHLGGRACQVTTAGVTIGGLILVFAVLELLPRFHRVGFRRELVPLGGLLSGFLGGLSGHQGALRTAFLVRLGLARETFLATGIVAAIVIDVVRLSVYAGDFRGQLARLEGAGDLVLAGTIAALTGSYVGRRLIHKVTMEGIRLLVGAMLVLLGLAIAIGVV